MNEEETAGDFTPNSTNGIVASTCTLARCPAASCIGMERSWYIAICPPVQNHCSRLSPPTERTWSSVSHVSAQGKAVTVLAHKLARAVYDMLKREVGGDLNTLLQSEGRGVGEPAASLGHTGVQPDNCALP